jgi:hypothetical protein
MNLFVVLFAAIASRNDGEGARGRLVLFSDFEIRLSLGPQLSQLLDQSI